VSLGLGLVAAATVMRAWLLQGTWFYLDDLVLTNEASRHPLPTHPGVLGEPYFGHLMPGGRVLAWLVTSGGPFDYAIARAELIVLFALCGAAALHLFLTLFGTRLVALAPLAYFLFSPYLVPATLWWAAGINHLPALASSCLALAAAVRHLRDRRRGDLVWSVVWVAVGLAFAELTLFVYVPMALLALGYFARGRWSDRLGLLWTRYRPAVLAHTVLGLAYAALYLEVAWETLPSSEPTDWSRFVTNAAVTQLPSVAIGGPGSWHQAWAAQLEVAPSGTVRLLGFVVVAAVVTLSALTRERAMRAWLLPLVELGICTVLVGKTRVLFGPGIALDPRFYTPLALGIALAGALAFIPVVRAEETVEVRSRHWSVDRAVPVVVALALFAAYSISSAQAFPLRHLGDQSPERFFSSLERQLAEHEQPVDLVDATVPGWVLAAPEAYYRNALVQLGSRVRIPPVVQDDFYVVDEDGRLIPPGLAVARSSVLPGPARCGYPVRTARTVPLDGPVFGYGWRVRVRYSAGRDGTATISLGDVDTDVVLRDGDHVLELNGDATYEGVAFSGLSPDVGLCVSSVTVGTTTIPDP
jgi:hypothetical protein